MSEMVESEALKRGMTHLLVNAAEAATGFYLRTGWRPESWDPAELTGIASRCVQMRKDLV